MILRYTFHLLFLLSLGLLVGAFLGQALKLWRFSPQRDRAPGDVTISPFARSLLWTAIALLPIVLGFAILVRGGGDTPRAASPVLYVLLYPLGILGLQAFFFRRQINQDNWLLFPLLATLNGVGLLMLYRLAVVADPQLPDIEEKMYFRQLAYSLVSFPLMGLVAAAMRVIALDNIHGDTKEVACASGYPGWFVRAVIGARTWRGQVFLLFLVGSSLLLAWPVGHYLKARAEGSSLAAGQMLPWVSLAGLFFLLLLLLRFLLLRVGWWEKRVPQGVWLWHTVFLLLLPFPFGREMFVLLGPIQFQPGELAKLPLLLYLTFLVMDYREGIGDWTQPLRERFAFLLRRAAPIGLAFVGYLLEGDLGPLILYLALIFLLFLTMTSRLVEGSALLLFFSFPILAYVHWPYQLDPWIRRLSPTAVDRIHAWINPWLHARGEQLVRALWAMKDGGLLGRGLGMGDPHLFPSEIHNDFIFSLIVHELGYLGGVFVIFLFLALLLQGLLIACRCRQDREWIGEVAFRLILAAGASLLLVIQAFFIVGGNMNFNLLSGVTLPFISAGGTSLIVSYSLAGFLLFCSLTEAQILGEGRSTIRPGEKGPPVRCGKEVQIR